MARKFSRRTLFTGVAGGALVAAFPVLARGAPSAEPPGEAERLAAALRELAGGIRSLRGRSETEVAFVEPTYARSEAWEETRYFSVGAEEFWYYEGEFVRRSLRGEVALLGARFRTPEGAVCATWVAPDPASGGAFRLVRKEACGHGWRLRSPISELLPTPAPGPVALAGSRAVEGRTCRLLLRGDTRFWVVPEPLRLLRLEWFGPRGRLAERKSFHDFSPVGEAVELPTRFVVERFAEDGSPLYRLITRVVELATDGDVRAEMEALVTPIREG